MGDKIKVEIKLQGLAQGVFMLQGDVWNHNQIRQYLVGCMN